MAVLENKSGAYIAPTTSSGQAALSSVQLPDNLIAWVVDPEPKEGYPIVTYTWLLVNRKYEKSKLAALQDLLKYSLSDGQKEAEPLGYIPMPAPVVEKVRAAVDTITAS